MKVEIRLNDECELAEQGSLHFFTLDPVRNLLWLADDVAKFKMDFADAEKAVRRLRSGGFDDWAQPTIEQIITVIDFNRRPAMNNAPMQESAQYWTSSMLPWASMGVRTVDPQTGKIGYQHAACSAHVRAVRTWQGPLPGGLIFVGTP